MFKIKVRLLGNYYKVKHLNCSHSLKKRTNKKKLSHLTFPTMYVLIYTHLKAHMCRFLVNIEHCVHTSHQSKVHKISCG